jgi:hypothetical protein
MLLKISLLSASEQFVSQYFEGVLVIVLAYVPAAHSRDTC